MEYACCKKERKKNVFNTKSQLSYKLLQTELKLNILGNNTLAVSVI